MIKTAEEECFICSKHKKAKYFNVLLMDLKEMYRHKLLHLIDHAAHYSATTIVKLKQKGEIVTAISKPQTTPFRAPTTPFDWQCRKIQ